MLLEALVEEFNLVVVEKYEFDLDITIPDIFGIWGGHESEAKEHMH